MQILLQTVKYVVSVRTHRIKFGEEVMSLISTRTVLKCAEIAKKCARDAIFVISSLMIFTCTLVCVVGPSNASFAAQIGSRLFAASLAVFFISLRMMRFDFWHFLLLIYSAIMVVLSVLCIGVDHDGIHETPHAYDRNMNS